MTKEFRDDNMDLRDPPVEIVKVKLRARKKKVPPVVVAPSTKDQSSEKIGSDVVAAEPEKKPPKTESNEQCELTADFNGNLIRKASTADIKLERNKPAMDTVTISRPGVQRSSSKLSLVNPSEIPGELFPLQEDLVDVAIAEVVTPSKLYVNLGKFKPLFTCVSV